MIAITGATGQLGSATIQFLLKKMEPTNIVAIVRNPERTINLTKQGIVIRIADYNNYEALLEAFKDVNKVLQISTIGVDVTTATKQEQNVVEAIKANKVGHIVYTSMVRANQDAIFNGTTTHYHTEQLIIGTQIPYTIFRNSMYMEAIPALIGDAFKTNLISYPSGSGKVSYVSRTDIAAALANVLCDSGHINQVYEITGEKAYTFSELARLIHPTMDHHDINESDYKQILQHHELPIEIIEMLLSMAKAIKKGEFSYESKTLNKLIGKKPLSLPEYLKCLKHVV